MPKWNPTLVGPVWLMDEIGRLIGYRDRRGGEFRLQQAQGAWGDVDPKTSPDILTLATDASGNPISLLGPNSAPINFTSLYGKLWLSMQDAYGKNPFDLQSTASTALVSSVTIPATTASLANPAQTNYFTTAGGYDSIRVDGIPYKDGTYGSNYVVGGNLMVTNASGQISVASMSSTSGSGFANMGTGQLQLNNTIHRARVSIGTGNTNKCAIWNVNGFGLSSNYFPMWCNGIPIAPTAGAVSNGLLQVNFANPGVYDLAIAAQQSLTVGGIYVDQDDSVIPFTKPRLPIILFGDSYTVGSTSKPSGGGPYLGDLTLASAISWIGGVNCIPHGASGTGLVCDGQAKLPAAYDANSFPYGYAGRLAYVAALANASGAPLIVVQGSVNDYTGVLPTSAITQAQTAAVLSYLLANTTCNIVLTGSMPANKNNPAAQQNVDAGYLAAVNAINSNRVAFIPVAGATPPWIYGTKTTAGSGATAGNSRYYTGNDSLHPSGLLTADQNIPANTVPNSGIEYIARKILDGVLRVAQARNW